MRKVGKKNIFNYFAVFFITYMRNGVVKDMQRNLYKKLISFPASFHANNKKGDTISRVTTDVSEVQRSFLSVFEMLIREPLTILFALIAMFALSAKLTLFVLVFIPIALVCLLVFYRNIGKNPNRRKSDFVNSFAVQRMVIGIL